MKLPPGAARFAAFAVGCATLPLTLAALCGPHALSFVFGSGVLLACGIVFLSAPRSASAIEPRVAAPRAGDAPNSAAASPTEDAYRQLTAVNSRARTAADELRAFRALTGIVRSQLDIVNQETRAACVLLIETLQNIDGEVEAILEAISDSATECAQLADQTRGSTTCSVLAGGSAPQAGANMNGTARAHPPAGDRPQAVTDHLARLIETQETTVRDVQRRGQVVADLVVGLLANLQFQDVTRQQIEHIAQAMLAIDEHNDALQTFLLDSGDRTEAPQVGLILEKIYGGYVMERQRQAHDDRNGAAADADTAKRSQSASPMVELF